jgi:hypothetical protein
MSDSPLFYRILSARHKKSDRLTIERSLNIIERMIYLIIPDTATTSGSVILGEINPFAYIPGLAWAI